MARDGVGACLCHLTHRNCVAPKARSVKLADVLHDMEIQRERLEVAISALKSLIAAGEDKPTEPDFSKYQPPPIVARQHASANVLIRPGPKPGTRHGLKVTPEGWARARPMWDADESAEKIGKAIGCSGARVNQYAKEKRWPARDYGVVSRKARLDSMAKHAQATGHARRIVTGTECPKCHVISPTDPCYNCGKVKGKK